MTSTDIDRRLKDLKRNKANRGLAEIESLLTDAGFTCREGKKNHNCWCRGKHTLTLAKPHDKVLKVSYISLVVRVIEDAQMEGQEEEERTCDEPSDT